MNEKILGVAVEEYPEPCRRCAALAQLARRHNDIDFTYVPFTASRRNRAIQLARFIFPRIDDECTDEVCGLTGKLRRIIEDK